MSSLTFVKKSNGTEPTLSDVICTAIQAAITSGFNILVEFQGIQFYVSSRMTYEEVEKRYQFERAAIQPRS